MRGVNGASWNNKCPCFVVFAFQVRKHFVEPHIDVPSNILSNDPSGPELFDAIKHCWPEVTVIIRALSLPGVTERLARVSAANKFNCFAIIFLRERSYVFVKRYIRPVFLENLLTKGLYFTEGRCLEKTSAFKAQRETSDP